MNGRGGAGSTTVRPPLDRARLATALAVITFLGGVGGVLGRAVGGGRIMTAQTGGSGSGGGSAGATGSSGASPSGNSGASGNSGNSVQGGSGSEQHTTPGGAPAPVAAPDDGSSGSPSGGSGASSPRGGDDGGGGTGNTSPNAPGPGDTSGGGTPGDTTLLACWGFGAANELFEFLSSLRFADAYVGGLDNAGWDLAFNTFGSVLAAICCALYRVERSYGDHPRGALVRSGPDA